MTLLLNSASISLKARALYVNIQRHRDLQLILAQPDIKKMQIQLTGFLDKDTASFCKELWKLCLSAQTNPQGVPKELLEAKKLELIQEKVPIYAVLYDTSNTNCILD